MTAQPSGVSGSPPRFVSSMNLLRVYTAPSSRSLLKMLSRVGSGIDPWGTPIFIGLQLGFVLLIPTLCACRSLLFVPAYSGSFQSSSTVIDYTVHWQCGSSLIIVQSCCSSVKCSHQKSLHFTIAFLTFFIDCNFHRYFGAGHCCEFMGSYSHVLTACLIALY